MEVTVYRTSAFPYLNKGGNEAGVVLNADALSDAQMINIAKRVKYSETAFLLESKKADFKLRYFSPTVEVPLCGHATIATFNLLRNLDQLDKTYYKIETKEGIFNIKVDPEYVTLELKTPTFYETIDPEIIEASLNIKREHLLDLPVKVVSTGVKEIYLGVKSKDYLHDLKLLDDQIIALTERYDAKGLYVYTLETENDHTDAHSRNFLPSLGIKEESATGTAAGALASFLYTYSNQKKKKYIFEQGYSMHKPSEIIAYLDVEGETITNVYVGGNMRFLDKIEGFNADQKAQ